MKVYNKYIGNTGTYIRVDEPPRAVPRRPSDGNFSAPPPPPAPAAPPVPPAAKKKASLLGGLGNGFGNLLGGFGGLGGLKGLGGSSGGLLNGLTDSFKGIFDHLPFGLDAGDLLLFLLLLFFFIESGDEEFLIILAIIAFSLIREN